MSNFSTEIINIVNYFIGSTIKCLHGVWSYKSVRLEKNCEVIAFEFFDAKNVWAILYWQYEQEIGKLPATFYILQNIGKYRKPYQFQTQNSIYMAHKEQRKQIK